MLPAPQKRSRTARSTNYWLASTLRVRMREGTVCRLWFSIRFHGRELRWLRRRYNFLAPQERFKYSMARANGLNTNCWPWTRPRIGRASLFLRMRQPWVTELILCGHILGVPRRRLASLQTWLTAICELSRLRGRR